ncbi:hypothetical protein MRB53_038479 [Persea americana]|nr:hypothetical protein MRB53_038479 [Persea americana]
MCDCEIILAVLISVRIPILQEKGKHTSPNGSVGFGQLVIKGRYSSHDSFGRPLINLKWARYQNTYRHGRAWYLRISSWAAVVTIPSSTRHHPRPQNLELISGGRSAPSIAKELAIIKARVTGIPTRTHAERRRQQGPVQVSQAQRFSNSLKIVKLASFATGRMRLSLVNAVTATKRTSQVHSKPAIYHACSRLAISSSHISSLDH